MRTYQRWRSHASSGKGQQRAQQCDDFLTCVRMHVSLRNEIDDN
ncbi:MAG: hypothetical protein ACI85K_000039 [Hyphomicrobiaceae bacterium]|jgi:hypothetical protein